MKKNIILFILLWILVFPAAISNAQYGKDGANDTVSYISYYSMYWTNHFKLSKLINPVTKKPLTLQEVRNLIVFLIKHESGFKSNTRSWEKKLKCYSYGYTRLLPSTARGLGWVFESEEELYDPEKNIKYGIKFFCMQINRYNGDLKKAVAAYNAGGCYYNKDGEYINQHYINEVYHAKYAKIYTTKNNKKIHTN